MDSHARSRQRRRVAVILQFWQNFDRGILQGIAAYQRERRTWSVFVEEVAHQRIPDFREWSGDGLIVNFDDRTVAQALRGIAQPMVGVGGGRGWHDPHAGIPYVATDDAAIGRLAAEHLLERGLKQFAFCGYPPTQTNIWADNRGRAFAARLREAGHACAMFRGRHTSAAHWAKELREIADWLRTLPTPVGIMGCYDYRARHVLEACKLAGLRVPDDAAVMGVDNDVVCELADPPLTSIEQGRFQIGYTAAAMLDRMMDGRKPQAPRVVIPPVGLVPRQSTDLLYVPDRTVAEAMRIVREEACRGLQAAAVAERLRVSRSTLDKRFKQHLGRPVDQEIRRIRLERARELLARTDLPPATVAREAGYGTVQYLNTVLGKAVHCTPTEYRRRHRGRGDTPAVPPPREP
jgi:LacI family transcriptional regulator